MTSAARRQIISGDAPISKSRRRRRPQIVGGDAVGGGKARPAHSSIFTHRVRLLTKSWTTVYRSPSRINLLYGCRMDGPMLETRFLLLPAAVNSLSLWPTVDQLSTSRFSEPRITINMRYQ